MGGAGLAAGSRRAILNRHKPLQNRRLYDSPGPCRGLFGTAICLLRLRRYRSALPTMTRQRQTDREAGTQSHGPPWGSRVAERRRAGSRTSSEGERETRSRPEADVRSEEFRGKGAFRLGGSRPERTPMSMRTRETTDSGSRRQHEYRCASRGVPVDGLYGVRPCHLPVADTRREESATKPTTRAPLDAWGSVGIRGPVSWGLRGHTVPGVLGGSDSRGPSRAAPGGGDRRPGRRWGPADPTAFPTGFSLGKENRASRGPG